MFEHMIAEVMLMNQKKLYHTDEWSRVSLHVVQNRPSLLNRACLAIGNSMISLGLKLKDRSNASLTTEQAPAPNFLIML